MASYNTYNINNNVRIVYFVFIKFYECTRSGVVGDDVRKKVRIFVDISTLSYPRCSRHTESVNACYHLIATAVCQVHDVNALFSWSGESNCMQMHLDQSLLRIVILIVVIGWLMFEK